MEMMILIFIAALLIITAFAAGLTDLTKPRPKDRITRGLKWIAIGMNGRITNSTGKWPYLTDWELAQLLLDGKDIDGVLTKEGVRDNAT